MIEVLKSGFYSSIQDMGRSGFEQFGVPVSGVMDRYSAKIANALVGNEGNAAVMEITMTGPVLQFHSETCICISGADMSPKLNDIPTSINKVIQVYTGDILSFGRLHYGFRAYLAVSGGFQTEVVMKSRSMYKNVSPSHVLSKGDQLEIMKPNVKIEPTYASIKINNAHFDNNEILVYKGPEYDLLPEKLQKQLFSKPFTISKNNNRMAYQLEEPLENNMQPIITSLVLPGTVQLTPSGQLIILMRDCQTSGGYPRILQLVERNISNISQFFTGNLIILRLSVFA